MRLLCPIENSFCFTQKQAQDCLGKLLLRWRLKQTILAFADASFRLLDLSEPPCKQINTIKRYDTWYRGRHKKRRFVATIATGTELHMIIKSISMHPTQSRTPPPLPTVQDASKRRPHFSHHRWRNACSQAKCPFL